MYHLQATAKYIFTVHAYRIATVKISRLHSTHFVEITVHAFIHICSVANKKKESKKKK